MKAAWDYTKTVTVTSLLKNMDLVPLAALFLCSRNSLRAVEEEPGQFSQGCSSLCPRRHSAVPAQHCRSHFC